MTVQWVTAPLGHCVAAALLGITASAVGKLGSGFAGKVAGFALMVGLNALMLRSLVKAMHNMGTVKATSVINAIAYIVSGVYGQFVFGEPIGVYWLAGIALILQGVYLISSPGEESKLA